MGPLQGVKIVELAGIGPGPFAGMLLSDMGADIVRVDRAAAGEPGRVRQAEPRAALPRPALDRRRPEEPRGRRARVAARRAGRRAFEGYRPGVTERLGLGPDVCLARNPKLVYGRMTGWGQDGPMAQAAGHDINYIALAGALAHFGRAGGKPTPPINLVGDFGGGGMFMAFGIVCGILEAQRSGKGQVLDVAMVDGSAVLMSMMWGLKQIGFWDEALGANLLDTGAPFYDTYETTDGKFISLGSLEPQFYAELIQKLGLESEGLPAQMDKSGWDTLRDALHRAVQDEDARRVGRDPRRERRVLRAGAHDVGGDEQRAHRRAQDDHRARRCAAARARAALLAHDGRGAALGAVARPAHRRGAGRLGFRRGPR